MVGTLSVGADAVLNPPDAGKTMKVFILAGQSNMEGRADGDLLSSEDRERLAKVQGRVHLAFNGESTRPLDVVRPAPEIAEIYKSAHIFGPELFFGITLAEAWPSENILLIKYTAGSTSLHGAWNAAWSREKAAAMGEENEPPLYTALMSYVHGVLSMYDDASYEIGAVLWVQGETDAGHETAAPAYGDNLRVLVEHIRRDLERDQLPFLLFQVGRGKVVEGMKEVARMTPNVILLPQQLDPDSSDFYPKLKNGHYDHEGQKKLGMRFADQYLARLAQSETGENNDSTVRP